MSNRYILRNGKKITLTYDDEQLLFRQECIGRAKEDIENLVPWNKLDDDQLAKLGERLIEADMAENSDRAFNCMKDFGLVMDEPEEEPEKEVLHKYSVGISALVFGSYTVEAKSYKEAEKLCEDKPFPEDFEFVDNGQFDPDHSYVDDDFMTPMSEKEDCD